MADIEKGTTEEVPATETPSAETSGAGKAKDKKAKAKNKKPNIFVRMGRRIKKFWKEYLSELKKVAWMSWKDVRKNTLLVVCAVIVFSLAIAVVDTVFGQIIEGIAGLVG